MMKHFVCILIFIVFCVPCFAEEMPGVPELIKKMYDYRMAIENMKADVTVTKPINTSQPHRETETQHFFFAYNKGSVRCDKTFSNSKLSDTWLYQYLSTPSFFYTRSPSGIQEVNDGNSLFVNDPLKQPFDTLDPRRIGLDWNSFDAATIEPFSYDTLLDKFYNARCENFIVDIDNASNENLYKISYQVNNGDFLNTYWIDPKKGYSLVRCLSESKALDRHTNYVVTLKKYPASKGDVWFPKQVEYKYKMKDDILEEKIVLDSVTFDVQDESLFSLAGLNIPIGYRVEYFNQEARYWDGKELVEEILYPIEPAGNKNRRALWIVNAVGFAVIVILILMRWLRRRYHR